MQVPKQQGQPAAPPRRIPDILAWPHWPDEGCRTAQSPPHLRPPPTKSQPGGFTDMFQIPSATGQIKTPDKSTVESPSPAVPANEETRQLHQDVYVLLPLPP